ERDIVFADEVLSHDEGVGQSAWLVLHGIGKLQAELRPVAEQTLEQRQILGCGNDEDLPDTRQHQGRQRIVNHRLVENRRKLLGNDGRGRVKTRAASARQNNPLHLLTYPRTRTAPCLHFNAHNTLAARLNNKDISALYIFNASNKNRNSWR